MPILTYEQQRFEYFKNRKAECERKLEWYKNRKSVGAVEDQIRFEKCTEYGKKISFYDDAMKVFGDSRK